MWKSLQAGVATAALGRPFEQWGRKFFQSDNLQGSISPTFYKKLLVAKIFLSAKKYEPKPYKYRKAAQNTFV